MPLKTMVLRDEKGSPLTNAEMDGNLRSVLEFMNGIVLPQTAHDLDDYDTPGVYGQNATAGAVAGSNYPVPVAGVLTVKSGGGAGNIVAQQTYRTYYQSSQVSEWYRNKGTAGWSPWYQRARMDQVMSKTVLSASAVVDANTLTTDNMWWVWTSGAVMQNGSNFPPAALNSSGIMETQVITASYMVQTCTLTPTSTRRPIEFRRIGNGSTTWSSWRVISPVQIVGDLPTADCGDVYVDGSGWYKWASGGYILASTSVLLPATAHNLNDYDLPSEWYQGTAAIATTANNYPVGAVGFLSIKQFGSAVLQTYVTRENTPRTFTRTKNGTTAWSSWVESASTTQAMTHVFLTSATDANTLTEDNVFYTWVASAALGDNFPQFSTNWPAAGYMRVYRSAPTQVAQELTFLITGQRSRTFTRFGNSVNGTWQPWKSTSAWHAATGLPTTDMGDIYVDGVGVYRWSPTDSSYVRWSPDVPNDLYLIKNTARIYGNFESSNGPLGSVAIKSSNTASPHTVLSIVPRVEGGASSVTLWTGDATAVAGLNINSSLTAHNFTSVALNGASHRPIVWYQVNERCGALNTAATWEFGPAASYPVLCRIGINFDGGSTRYGVAMRPNANDTRFFHFCNAAGGDVGSITQSASAVFYNTTSDYRVKKEIEDLDVEVGLNSVLMARPRKFRMKEDNSLHNGFIAHELQEVIPEAVTGVKDDVWPVEAGNGPRMRLQGVDMSKLVPHLVAAVQALNKKLDAAFERIAELERRQ
ncbi:putative tail fiber protein [Achromobacter phage vB_AxyS_19-32_Axy06]|nr:putative tail fiber protein [Achromobacter phage vB_AxyS_19-32_Axy06]